MSKQKKQSADKAADRGPVLYIRLSADQEVALQAFINAQLVRPDRTAVGMAALEAFLATHGYWPPKK